MAFSEPQKNIEQLELKPGERVADLGCGVGAYSLAAAPLVGVDGKVYAVDIQKDLLERLRQEADRQGWRNIEVVWGDVERVSGSGLADGLVDAVIMANVLFMTKSVYTTVAEVKRILKGRGRLLVIDWSESFGGLGPQPGDVFDKNKAKQVFEGNGFALLREFPAGDHHNGLVFQKS
ncbi:MAG TPA: methyltransferase domain-containing protein [Candidatus Paceibacterota bacterium]|nr:methyltransferase domain-containing protein [Candidatus Paceibacterota bacterium]